MLNLYPRLSSISGVGGGGYDDDEGYGVFSGLATDACTMIVVFCVVAASVVIWEACAFAAMAALLLGAVWCLAPRSRASWWRASAERPAAAPATEDGLTDTVIDEALPASLYERRVGPSGGVTCCVCLEDVRGNEMVRSLPECQHLFHAACIDVWLHTQATCPLCRYDL